jgi:2-amino-4-hydroxy-6-hydroxymethyldihydropteridine diphosphokinase
METAYIGLGGNLDSWAGEPEATLAAAALRLESLGRMIHRSSLYSTEPVGFAAQPRFVNAAVALETELSPQELLQGLLAIEQEFGRDRPAGLVNGPRTLDLDILLFGNHAIREPELEIPHPRLAERAFALAPLSEIAPQAAVPGCGHTVEQLLDIQLAKNRSPSTASGQACVQLRPSAVASGALGAPDAVLRVRSTAWHAWPAGARCGAPHPELL